MILLVSTFSPVSCR